MSLLKSTMIKVDSVKKYTANRKWLLISKLPILLIHKKFYLNTRSKIQTLLLFVNNMYNTGCQESSRSIFKFNVIQKLQ